MAGDDAKSRDHFRFVGLMFGLVGFTAATAEILNYLEVKPRDLVKYASLVLISPRPVHADAAPTSTPTPAVTTASPSPVMRPARLVLIVKNSGDTEAMRRVLLLASRISARLVPGDSVSLITFVNGRHVWILKDVPGDQAREEIERRTNGLFSVDKVTVQAAVDEAVARLKAELDSESNAAVVVLSAGVDDTTLDRWIEQVRKGAGAREFVLAAADGLSDNEK